MKIETQHPDLTEEWQQLALGAALITRMYPNFALFDELQGLKGTASFNNILSLVWEFISGKNQRIDFTKQQEKLELITPNPEDHDMYGVWPALDATVALACLLVACERWDQQELNSLVKLSTSTISHYLEAVEEVDSDHPLYKAEQSFINHMASTIVQSSSSGRVAVVARVKAELSELEDSNIGIAWPG